MTQKPPLIIITGPTAVGKTALSVELAKRIDGEIISADSMQVYRGMDIGTAKPTAREQAAVPHHLIDLVDPLDAFSCADYVRLADAAIEAVTASGRKPVFCGGTGLYLDAVIRGLASQEIETDEGIRQELAAIAAGEGPEKLHEMLRAADPEAAQSIHPNNIKRVIRALEIYRATGKTKTETDRLSVGGGYRYDPRVIGIRYESRELLNRRIGERVDRMMVEGLPEETEKLLRAGVFSRNRTAAQAIGYKELIGYIEGSISREQAVEDLKQATRRYAKRQMTWFKARSYVQWVTADEEGRERPFESILAEAERILFG